MTNYGGSRQAFGHRYSWNCVSIRFRYTESLEGANMKGRQLKAHELRFGALGRLGGL